MPLYVLLQLIIPLKIKRRRHRSELCRKLGDGADQAAWLSAGMITSMPSENLTPAMTFGK